MRLSCSSFTVLILGQKCLAGPLIGLIAAAAEAAIDGAADAVGIILPGTTETYGEAASNAILGSRIASAFGWGPSEGIWVGDYVVVDQEVYVASKIVGGSILAGAVGAGVAAGVGYEHITGIAASKAIMSLIHSASKANASLESSIAHSESLESAALKVSAADARASVESLMNAPAIHDTAKDPFTFTFSTAHKNTDRVPPPPTKPAPAPTSAPPPPGRPISTLVAGQSPPPAVPSGVPAYNWRMCQNDLIQMGQNKQNLVMDQPAGQAQSIVVSGIPPTCMVLSSYLVGNPSLGPHPVVMGADKLQWNNIDVDTMHLIRQTFGGEPKNATLFKEAMQKKQ